MISEEIAYAQWGRLSEFEGFHSLKAEAVQDYIWAIQTADTPEIATRVIDDIKGDEGREKLPTSSYVRGAMNDENARRTPNTLSDQMAQWKAERAREEAAGIDVAGEMRELERWITLQSMHMQRKPMSPALREEHEALRARLRSRYQE